MTINLHYNGYPHLNLCSQGKCCWPIPSPYLRCSIVLRLESVMLRVFGGVSDQLFHRASFRFLNKCHLFQLCVIQFPVLSGKFYLIFNQLSSFNCAYTHSFTAIDGCVGYITCIRKCFGEMHCRILNISAK